MGKGQGKGTRAREWEKGKTKVVFNKGATRRKEYSRVYHSAYDNAMQKRKTVRGPSPVPG